MSEELKNKETQEQESLRSEMLKDFELIKVELSDHESDKINKKTGKPIIWKKVDFTFNYMGEELSSDFILNRYLLDAIGGFLENMDHDCKKNRKCTDNYCIETGSHISAEQQRNEASTEFVKLAFKKQFLQEFLDIAEEAGEEDNVIINLILFAILELLPKVQPQES